MDNDTFVFDGDLIKQFAIKEARKLFVNGETSRVLVYPNTEKFDNRKITPYCFGFSHFWTRKQRIQEFNFNVWLFNSPQYIKIFHGKPAFYIAVN